MNIHRCPNCGIEITEQLDESTGDYLDASMVTIDCNGCNAVIEARRGNPNSVGDYVSIDLQS